MRLPSLLVVSAALLTGLTGLTACGDEEVSAPRRAATPLPDVTTATTTATTTTTGPAVSTPAPTTTSAAPTPTKPAFPKAVTAPTQGGTYFAVYLAVARGTAADATSTKAEAEAKAAGYDSGTGDIDCDQGARAALKLDKTADYLGTSIFFATAALAKQFVDAYEPAVVGTAQIKAYCLD